MIEWLKYHARIELEQIRHPDAPYAWAIIGSCTIGIIIWTIVMRAGETPSVMP